jgi:PAS domain S-box-containing protein
MTAMSIIVAAIAPVACDTLCEQLQQAVFGVVRTHDPAQIPQLIAQHPPTLVLIDPQGQEAASLAMIAEVTAAHPSLPVLMVSAEPTAAVILEALRHGAWDCLSLPVTDMAAVLARLHRALDRAGTARNVPLGNSERQMHQWWSQITACNGVVEAAPADRNLRERLILHARREWERTVDALPDLIFIVDTHHRIIRVNKAMRDRLGMRFDAIHGHPCFFCTQDRKSATEPCPHDLLLADRKQRTVAMEEPQLGGWFELTVVPYYDAEGELAGSIHIARDVSTQRQAQRDQEKLQARLLHSAKLESVGQLAAGIAHEINTPAQFITANVEFLDESFVKVDALCSAVLEMLPSIPQGTVTDEQIRQLERLVAELDWEYLKEELPLAISQSKEGLQRVTSIVQAIKEFSHPGSKQKTAADLNRIIETTITVARNEWKYVATVQTQLDPDLVAIPCYADEIGQVILNILINAAHALESTRGQHPEGRRGQITITSAHRGDYAEIRIADNGPGIPEAIQHKVFDPFFTTKQVGKGTGQGLAIAHDVITNKHDGTLSFETSPETGTTFIIRLPSKTTEPVAAIE